MKNPRDNFAIIEEVLTLYLRRFSCVDIAQLLGISAYATRRILRDHGIEVEKGRRKRKKLKRANRERVARMMRDTYNRKIAELRATTPDHAITTAIKLWREGKSIHIIYNKTGISTTKMRLIQEDPNLLSLYEKATDPEPVEPAVEPTRSFRPKRRHRKPLHRPKMPTANERKRAEALARKDEILQLYQSEMSYMRIYFLTGVSIKRIQDIVHEHGKPRGRGEYSKKRARNTKVFEQLKEKEYAV